MALPPTIRSNCPIQPRSKRVHKRQETLHPRAPLRPYSRTQSEIPDKVHTHEGDAANISMDYTLSEEGEGDNISGNKELRKDGVDEDENSSKRAKGPLPTETT